MGVSSAEFDSFEQQFLDLIGEFKSISMSESRLRDAVQVELTRAGVAETARVAAERTATEARASAAAASAGAAQAAAALSQAHDQLTALKMQVDLAERQRILSEERCSQLSTQLSAAEREVQQLRPVQTSFSNLQRQYQELQERIRSATDAARTEASRLESELRRVERCAGGGAEVRERARLAAAAHARERRLATAELQHTSMELRTANSEIARLNSIIMELRHRITLTEQSSASKENGISSTEPEALLEARAALEAERAGAARLERALDAALKDNAALAAQLHAADTAAEPARPLSPKQTASNNMSALDSFLAD